eukprot:gnl/Spiro4/5908_TR3019_c0_g1_i1.p1 gnl/Spiro4/5908_TR3019_c0_g1~~gnl/Spiro4/5908_TR3019_c0_g1_i1.p1  ORF type:complete len:224 (+),score=35.45 gnl/Spiro4/5908_TR3019_c0_g1_i1:32-673(+)
MSLPHTPSGKSPLRSRTGSHNASQTSSSDKPGFYAGTTASGKRKRIIPKPPPQLPCPENPLFLTGIWRSDFDVLTISPNGACVCSARAASGNCHTSSTSGRLISFSGDRSVFVFEIQWNAFIPRTQLRRYHDGSVLLEIAYDDGSIGVPPPPPSAAQPPKGSHHHQQPKINEAQLARSTYQSLVLANQTASRKPFLGFRDASFTHYSYRRLEQ